MQKTVVLWDWDGTVIDSRGAIALALQETADRYNQEPVTPDEVANVMSFHKGAFWIRRFATCLDEAFDYFLERLKIHNQNLILYPGIEACFDYLKAVGATQIVASNCPETLLTRECHAVHLTDYFERICGVSLTDDVKKPSALFGDKALKGVPYDRLVMIGDGASDMLFARNIGALAIYVQAPAFRDPSVPYDIYCADRTSLLATLHQLFGEA